MHLASGQLGLAHISYLVADDDLACEELLIGLPVIKQLQIDTRTLLETNRAVLHGSDCSHIGNPTANSRGGSLSRLMTARRNSVANSEIDVERDEKDDRPHVDYFECRTVTDPFPDPSLLDPIDHEQRDEVVDAVGKLLEVARSNGMPQRDVGTLRDLVSDHIDIFRTSLSSGPPADFKPLRIDLREDSKPVRVRLRN